MPTGADRSNVPPTGVDRSPIAELVQKVAAGDPAAFNELYYRTRVAIYRTAVAVLRDVSQAEEVTQEVFAEIWRSADRFDPGKGSAASWIRRFAHSRAVDRVRHAQSVHDLDQVYHYRNRAVEVDDVVEQVLRNATTAKVREALDHLTALQREALLLTYLHDNSNEQASNLLGIPVSTLKSRVLSALASLRRTQTELN